MTRKVCYDKTYSKIIEVVDTSDSAAFNGNDIAHVAANYDATPSGKKAAYTFVCDATRGARILTAVSSLLVASIYL